MSGEDICFVCREQFSGPFVATSKDKYHTNCFRCHQCLKPFPNNEFFETPEGFFCEDDYNVLCLARCGNCAEVITGKCISALDAKWHLEHFVCESCGRSLVGESFVRKDDKPYCKLCPLDRVKLKLKKSEGPCEFCKLPIEKTPLLFKGIKYHGHHFYCSQCHKQLDHSAREYDGELSCFPCYEKINSKICGSCRKPILGASVSALGKIFHMEHFICFKCETPFNGAAYFEHDKQVYCDTHYKQATGSICYFCRKAVKGNAISALGGKWCDIHFQCLGCFVNLSDLERSKFMDFDGKPFCRRCFEKVPFTLRRSITRYNEKDAKYA